MTILEVQNLLYSHFLTSDTFVMERDWESIKITEGCADDKDEAKALENARKDIIELALGEYEKGGLIKKVSPGFWMLTQPLWNNPQFIAISPEMASIISDLINEWYTDKKEDNDGSTIVSNKAALSSRDIEMLLDLTFSVMNSYTKLATKISGEQENDEGDNEEDEE